MQLLLNEKHDDMRLKRIIFLSKPNESTILHTFLSAEHYSSTPELRNPSLQIPLAKWICRISAYGNIKSATMFISLQHLEEILK